VRWLRRVLLILLGSLLVGFAIGTVLRLRLERPTTYIGSAVPPLPLHVALPSPPILHAGHHEQQVG
jgi:hypothetical protein